MPDNNSQISAADILSDVGRVLFDSNIDARLAQALNVREDTVRHWRTGRQRSLTADHKIFDEVLALVETREREMRRARDKLRRWIKQNRQA